MWQLTQVLNILLISRTFLSRYLAKVTKHFQKTEQNAWIETVLCFHREIQPIVIRAPAGWQDTSEQERTVKSGLLRSDTGLLRQTQRPINAPRCSSQNRHKRLASSLSISKDPSRIFSEGSESLPPLLLVFGNRGEWWEEAEGRERAHNICVCVLNTFFNTTGNTGRY